MATYAKSNEEQWIDALTTIIAGLLAGSTDRIYPAHAEEVMIAVDVLLGKAQQDGDQRLAKSLTDSRERLERILPHGWPR
jgi:hypothetical protein